MADLFRHPKIFLRDSIWGRDPQFEKPCFRIIQTIFQDSNIESYLKINKIYIYLNEKYIENVTALKVQSKKRRGR